MSLKPSPVPVQYKYNPVETLTAMNNDQINSAIATRIGWISVNRPGAMSGWDNYALELNGGSSTRTMRLPDYCNSLDAMHTAEMWLKLNNPELIWDYTVEVFAVMYNNQKITPLRTRDFTMLTIPANFRAEAWLRVMNLWVESCHCGKPLNENGLCWFCDPISTCWPQ